MAKSVDHVASELWWLGIVQGIAAILFGIAAVFWPGLTLATLVILFSAFVLAWGIVSIVHGVLAIRTSSTWWLSLLFGVAGTGVGLYLVRHPGASFRTVILLIGFTLIFRGVVDILAGFLDKLSTTSRILWIIVGAAAVLAGIFVLNQPVTGGVAFVWVLGLYSLVFGPLMIAMAIELRKDFEALDK